MKRTRTVYVALPDTIVGGKREGGGAGGACGAGTTRLHASPGTTCDYRATLVDDNTTVRDVLRSLVARQGPISRDLVLLGCHSQRRWRWSERLESKGGLRETFYTVAPLARGGGADGGSTGAEDRKAMLEMYADDKPAAVDPKELRLAKYTMCQLSQEPLSAPVICDDLGQLYNKEAFLQALISKTIPKALGHLSRKTVFDVELTELDSASEGIKYGCPVTSLPLNGKVRFVVVRDGNVKGAKGWVVSNKAAEELKEVVREVTGGYTEVLPLYPEGEELEKAMKKMGERLAMKKGKKRRGEGSAEETKDEAARGKLARTNDARAVQGTQPTNAVHSEAYKSIFRSKDVAGPTNTSNDFMVRGVAKRR